MKNQKGITLIALIITIIVMMILVGVTVTVAMNGGLFGTADDSTKRTEKNSIHEQMIAAMKLTENGNINVKGTYDEVVKMFGDDKVEPIDPEEVKDTTTEVTFTVTGKRGTYTYKITGTGIENPDEDGGGGGQNPPETLTFPYGKYYELGYDEGWEYKVFTENSYKEGDILYKIVEIQLKDYETIEGKVTLEDNRDEHRGESIEATGGFKYIVTEDAVFLDMSAICGMYCVKSKEGVIYDLEGKYTSEGNGAFEFSPGTGIATRYTSGGYPYYGGAEYVSFGGKYYMQGYDYGEMVFTDGYKSFTVGGITYTNENASENANSAKQETTLETIIPTNLEFLYGTYDCGGHSLVVDEKSISTESYEVEFDDMESFSGKLSYEAGKLYANNRYGEQFDLNYIKEGNDAVMWGEGLGLYATSKNAFKSINLDLEGEYVNPNGNVKYIFEKGNHIIKKYDRYLYISAYINVDGKYYIFNEYSEGQKEIQISPDKEIITINGTEYTRVH